jgi:hypothetical protein
MEPGSAAAPIFEKMTSLTLGPWAMGVPLRRRVLPSLRDLIWLQKDYELLASGTSNHQAKFISGYKCPDLLIELRDLSGS